MSQPGFVLVHGGEGGPWVWDRLRPLLPLPSVALDLGQADGRPPVSLTFADFTANALRQVDSAGIDDATVVAHSLGGLTAVALAAMRPELVRHLVLIACAVPRAGRPTVAGFPPPAGTLAAVLYRFGLRTGRPRLVPKPAARRLYCHGLSRADQDYVFAHRRPEAPRVLLDPFPDVSVPPHIPITWVRLRRDRGVFPSLQDRMRANLGRAAGDVTVIELDAPHMVMLSAPALLAEVLPR